MSLLIECLFGKDRDVFTSVTLIIALGLMFPFAINNEDDIFLACSGMKMIIIGCIIHLVLFGASFNDIDLKYDKGYFVSVFMIVIGDLAFFMSNISKDCSNYQQSDSLYRVDCWYSNFIIHLANFFMILYLIPLIFINRCCGDFKVKTWFKSDRFRLLYLTFCNILAVISQALYVHFYYDNFNEASRAFCYASIFLAVTSIVISLCISSGNNNKTIATATHRRYSPLYTWWMLNSVGCLFGCLVYWDIKTNVPNGLYYCAQFVIWSGWNLWIMAESFVPINVTQKNPYQMIQV